MDILITSIIIGACVCVFGILCFYLGIEAAKYAATPGVLQDDKRDDHDHDDEVF